jgi:acetyl-CoA carboxylase biotin carboxyl carrier protein
MALSDDDVREILRQIDESDLAELRIETDGLSLHVSRGDLAPTPGPAAAAEPALDPAPAPVDDGLLTIEAPMIGTFYCAPGPGERPFVEVGTEVEPGTVVCIIEVMKMMNSVSSTVGGTIVEVCRENAQPVEYGQPLFRVRPA